MVAGVLSLLVMTLAGGVVGALSAGPYGLLTGLLFGVLLGAVFGWAVAATGAYPRSVSGALLFLLDHTWSLPNTVAGAAFLTSCLLRHNELDRPQSAGSCCVHLAHSAIPGYATTVGTVKAGVTPHIRRHEQTHVLQARIFGPLYLPLVAANYVLATVVPYWLLYHDRVERPITGVAAYLRCGVYPHTWHERWAYRIEGTPPR